MLRARWLFVFFAWFFLNVALVSSCASNKDDGHGSGGMGGGSTGSSSSGFAGASASGRAAGMIGPEGGTVTHPAGASVVIPPGALDHAVEISVEGSTAPPDDKLGAPSAGPAFVLGPEGQSFLKPVQVIVPYDPTRLPTGTDINALRVFIAPQESNDFSQLETTVDPAQQKLLATTTHFSFVVPAAPISGAPIFITTTSPLPNGTVGAAYGPVAFTTAFAIPPLTWTIVPGAGALPAGLSLSSAGALSGTPTAAGSFSFTVRVKDSAQSQIEKAFSLEVGFASNPVPVLTAISPTTVPQGSASTTITLTGSSFVPQSQVQWNGSALTTIYVNPTQLMAVIPAANLALAGPYTVTVTNPAPGGGASSGQTFTVTPGPVNPVPSITSIDPTSVSLGAGDTQISVHGSDFIASSLVVIGTQALATLYVSPTELYAVVPSAYLQSPGTLQVGVYNPAPGGGYSPTNELLAVGTANPVPTLANIVPMSAVAGTGQTTLTLQGTGFVSGGIVMFGTTILTPIATGSTEVTVLIPDYLLVSPNNVQVTFVNPAPGGGTSNGLSFLIIPPGDGSVLNPTALLTGLKSPLGIAVDSTQIYWTEMFAGTINRMPKTGGPVSIIASGQPNPHGIATDGINVYWVNQGTQPYTNGSVMSAPVGGGPVSTIALSQYEPRDIIVDDANIYWQVGDLSGTIRKAPKNGGAVTDLTGAWTEGLASDGAFLFHTGRTGLDGWIAKIGVDGSGWAKLTTLNHVLSFGVAVDVNNVYWLNESGNVWKVSKAGGLETSLAPCSLCGKAIGVDDTHVYFGDFNQLKRVSINGGVMQTVAQQSAYRLALDDEAVYWVNAGGANGNDGSLMVALKSGLPFIGSDAGVDGGTGGSGGSGLGPEILSVTPNEALVGSNDLPISVQCKPNACVTGSIVRADGIDLPTTGTPPNLFATLPKSVMVAPKTLQITVVNPGSTDSSNILPFTLTTTGNSVPFINSITPAYTTRGASGVSLVITGGGLIQGTKVYFDGWDFPATYSVVGGTPRLTTATLDPFWQLGTATTIPIFLVNPTPGGGASAIRSFTITGTNPMPTITSVSPSSVGQGTSDYVVTLAGSNFLPKTTVSALLPDNSTVMLGFCDLGPMFSCRVKLTGAMLASPGTIKLTATNPGAANSTGTLTVVAGNPTPQATSVTPSQLIKGDTGQTITIAGSGFNAGSTIVETTTMTSLTVTGFTFTSMTADVPNSLVANAGALSFQVVNPAPGGGTSSLLSAEVIAIPKITSISPTSTPQGVAVVLTIDGTDLDGGGQYEIVRVGAFAAQPSMISATTLTVTIPGSAISTAGTYPVSVFIEGVPESNVVNLTVF